MTTVEIAALGSACIVAGAVLAAFSRGFTVSKIGAFGIEFTLTTPIRVRSHPKLWPFAVMCLFSGTALGLWWIVQVLFPISSPTQPSQVGPDDVIDLDAIPK